MDSSEKRGIEVVDAGPRFLPPEEADEQPWNHLPDSPQDSEQPPPGPEEPAPAPASAKAPRTVPLLAYLTALLAAGFLLMTAVCVLQFRDSQRELDEVRGALESVQAVDQLQTEKARLQTEIAQLQTKMETLAEEKDQQIQDIAEELYELNQNASVLELNSSLWFIQEFMEAGDYGIAAVALISDVEAKYYLYGAELNPTLAEQYEGWRQQLIDLDYLKHQANNEGIERSDSEQGKEALEWYALWSALYSYYIEGDYRYSANMLLVWRYTFGRQELLEKQQGSFVIKQYELLLERLVNGGFLVETERGGLDYGPRFYEDGITNDAYDNTPDDGPVAD